MDYPEIDRYLANVREILSMKAQKDGKEYKDIKYVQMASGTAYRAVGSLECKPKMAASAKLAAILFAISYRL